VVFFGQRWLRENARLVVTLTTDRLAPSETNLIPF
jgi:hypothetical protein